MTNYIALIRKTADSDFGVSFPDFPGCATAGRTLDEAMKMAREALALHVEGMAAEGLEIPPPSAAEDILADLEAANGDDAVRGVVPTLIPAPTIKARAVRLNITLDENLLARIDEVAGRGERSAFLAEAARSVLKMPAPRGRAAAGKRRTAGKRTRA